MIDTVGTVPEVYLVGVVGNLIDTYIFRIVYLTKDETIGYGTYLDTCKKNLLRQRKPALRIHMHFMRISILFQYLWIRMQLFVAM